MSFFIYKESAFRLLLKEKCVHKIKSTTKRLKQNFNFFSLNQEET